jgi:hypothetical protein
MFLIIANSLILNIYSYAVNGKLAIPKFFRSYSVFILILFIHTILAHGYWEFFELFLAGGIFWFTVYNFPESLSKKITGIIIFVGYLTGLIFLYNYLSRTATYNFSSLAFTPTSQIDHANIGDFWAIVILIIGWQMLNGRTYRRWTSLLMGIFFLIASLSRSAYVALAAGIYYIFYRLGFNKRYKKVFGIILVVIAVIFVFAGAFKTTLFGRAYYAESLVGIINHPLGLGMGRFYQISAAGPVTASSYVHNIILEFILGMGIFSVFFLWWLARVLYSMFKEKGRDVLFSAIFILMFVDFCFGLTYSIPVFILLWFISLGLAQQTP